MTDLPNDPVCKIDQECHTLRLDEMFMSKITIAKMESKRHIFRDTLADAPNSLEYPFFGWREMGNKERIYRTPLFDL
jgi:hypothetical protein